MIEGVEKFGAELHGLTFMNADRFRKRHIPVVLARPEDETAARIAK